MTLDAETILGLGQLGILGGIFWRMGSLSAHMESVKNRVSNLERKVEP